MSSSSTVSPARATRQVPGTAQRRRSGSLRFTKLRMRRITSPARAACAVVFASGSSNSSATIGRFAATLARTRADIPMQ